VLLDSATSAAAPARAPQLRALAPPPLRVADVALFYGERSGGIRTYVEAKAAFAGRTGLIEHHLIVPGRPARSSAHRHEMASLCLNPFNGYRFPAGARELHRTLEELAPDVVLLHDAFWAPRGTARVARRAGAAVVAVHHASVAMHAMGVPGPRQLTEPLLRRWYGRAYRDVDAVMSVVDPLPDCGRPATLALRLGVDHEFRPQPAVTRGRHVLYVGRLAPEKGLRELLQAASLADDPWTLVLRGAGPEHPALAARARRLGLASRVRFLPFVADRAALARTYAGASCVVLPGPHETFGLVALEAAASGAPVVTASSTPAGKLLGHLAETFEPGDPAGLLAAVERARRRSPDPAAAGALGLQFDWHRVLAAEVADLGALLCR
jgi:alpha-1,6-mannosyltransferase